MLKFKVGENVIILTDRCFQSANGTLYGKKVEKQILPIKKTAPLASHPYALEGIDGWFNERDLKLYKEIKVKPGDKVKLLKNETYTHQKIDFSKDIIYTIINIDMDVATITRWGKTKFKVNVYDLKKVD